VGGRRRKERLKAAKGLRPRVTVLAKVMTGIFYYFIGEDLV